MLGCRVFATHACVEQMSLADTVLTYRDEYRIETNFARLKGQPLSISPMYLHREDHIKGLIPLVEYWPSSVDAVGIRGWQAFNRF